MAVDTIVAGDAIRIILQRGLIDRLRSDSSETELERDDVLEAMLEEQTRRENQLVLIQAKLTFRLG
jgi:hypothetical protein